MGGRIFTSPDHPESSERTLAALYRDLGTALAALTHAHEPFSALTAMAVEIVDGAQYAGITRALPGQLQTLAPTDDLVDRVDALQYELGSGPSVDAVLQETVFSAGDLRTDARWPRFGWRAFEETGVVSMLSFRLYLDDEGLRAGLNMYSTAPHAFNTESTFAGTLLATHGSVAIALALSRARAAHLERTIASSPSPTGGALIDHASVTANQASSRRVRYPLP
jgi:hypothetical protein